MKQYARRLVQAQLDALHSDAGAVVVRMQTLQRTIERGAAINSLGELQGMALDIDRRCAQIGILRELLDFQET